MRLVQSAIIGCIGGFCGNAVLGALFSLPAIRGVLYDPRLQSPLFIDITPSRDIAISVAGLVLLSGIHGILYALIEPALSGWSWVQKGACLGIVIWAVYWLFQEWFIYITLLREPVALAVLELAILLFGSLIEGLAIAGLFCWHERRIRKITA